jgi:hypothetical protein
MLAGQLAFAFSAAFTGAALYITLVEQPARLSLDDTSMVREWAPSDRRGFALLGGLALIAAIAGLAAYGSASDVRWLIGALIVLRRRADQQSLAGAKPAASRYPRDGARLGHSRMGRGGAGPRRERRFWMDPDLIVSRCCSWGNNSPMVPWFRCGIRA